MTRTIQIALAASLALAAAMPVLAQRAPEAATGTAADERTPRPAQFRGGRDGPRHHRGGMDRGGPLVAFGPMGAAALFEEADADADGSLTQEEVDAFLAARLAAADANGDGALALDEFEPIFNERMRPRMVDAFQALDADGSGAITSEEVDDRFGRVVARMDRDGDGALSLQDGRARRAD